MPASNELLVTGAAGLLLLAGLALTLSGLLALRRPRRALVFRRRHRAQMRGATRALFGVLLLGVACLASVFGQPAIEIFRPPTATPTVSPMATATSSLTATPTLSPPPSQTPTPTITLTPSATFTPSLTPTATLSPTPALPRAQVTFPAGTLTVTPPPQAVIANLRMSRFNACRSQSGVATKFSPNPKTLYALFDYNNWLPGVRWSNVWLYNGQPLLVETLLWDGSTGGCGYADFDNGGRPWPAGEWEVQIFIGDRWLDSTRFTIAP